jgi:ABC-type uncharacterized transport system substrate-binding protein
MWANIHRLALGLILIAAAAALLLFSDLRSRVSPHEIATPEKATVRLAILQHDSIAILDQGREGMVAGLAEQGWISGRNLDLTFYNAQGDQSIGQAIAKEMISGHFNMLLTISTVSLQAVANANRKTEIPHVFALVTDPVAAGVGVSPDNPLDHPAWLAGYGTMQPVAKSFTIAREMKPDLQTVGVVWNAAEANSEAQIKLARQFCSNAGITLLEATVENSAGVGEAAASLTARGAEALWVCGDVTVITAIDTVIAAANKAAIPVFTVIPPNIKRGALFDLGADYHEVGRLAGSLAGEILHGRQPATVPIENVMPEILTINLHGLKNLNGRWKIPESRLKNANLVIDENGIEKKNPALSPDTKTTPAVIKETTAPNPSGKKRNIAIVQYNETPPSEETLAGIMEAWKSSPLVEGRDYTLSLRSAQGDMSAIPGCLDTAVTEGANLIVPLSTPTLQTTIARVRKLPIVFSLVANPVAVGAGTSDSDHLPNVTGVSVMAPVDGILDFMQKYYPEMKRFGSLFCPAEVNSVHLKEALEAECQKRGLTLETVAVNSAGELADSALALMSRPIDAVLQISDNLSSSGFSAITKAARRAQKPLISMNSTTIPQGAGVSIGRDYHAAGIETTRMIERVIAGEDPANIPFLLPPKMVLSVSRSNAAAVGMSLPAGLVEEANHVLE